LKSDVDGKDDQDDDDDIISYLTLILFLAEPGGELFLTVLQT
jgi:hypothetical protein